MSEEMQSVDITTWSEFDSITAPGGSYSGWAFRGRADANWPNYSSLSRHLRGFGVHPDV